jgi:hypothetical protein
MPEENIKINSLDYWKAEIRMGLRYKQIFGRSQDWSRYKTMYRGFWGKDTVPVNIVYALGRSIVPQIYFRNPRISVSPKKPGYTMHARVMEQVDNYLIRETGLKNELKSGILDCYLCGRGQGIIGYDSEYGYNPSFLSDEYTDLSLTSFSRKGEKIEYSDNVKPGLPWYMRCNPTDFVVPWGTGRWEDARWCAFRKMRPLRDIKEDPKYNNKSDLKAPYKTRIDSTETNSQPHIKSCNEWVELWEIHDKRSGHLFVISLDHDTFLRAEYDYLQTEGLPAEVIGFNEDPDYFWWTPDVRLIEVQQLEMNDIRTMAKRHRRVALLKILYDKGMMGKDSLSKLLDEDPKAAVEIDAGANGDVRKAVALFQSHIPPDLISAAREVREDVREIVGFSRNQMGSFEESSGRRTATEAGIVKAASMIRIDERRDIMADHLEKIIRKMNQLIFENWGAERLIDIVGEDGAKYWIRFTGKEVRGEFAYKINPEETVAEDRRTRRAEIMEYIQVASQTPGMDMKYLLESYAGQLGDWLDPRLLFPGDGAGRSPEKAMAFTDFMRMGGNPQSRFPGLAL